MEKIPERVSLFEWHFFELEEVYVHHSEVDGNLKSKENLDSDLYLHQKGTFRHHSLIVRFEYH